ncbi:Arginine ABC transporter [Klebsiella pneumoniae]|nr:Arginine ABC transporter [Klebsiella pneumoniae]
MKKLVLAALLTSFAFGAAGIIYLIVNGLLTLLMRLVERKALAFERRS